MHLLADNECMVFIVVIGIIAFFPLALAYGKDSRPYDARPRRWL